MVAAGDYKTASNMYTETTFTSEHREMAASLNRDFYEQLVDGIARGREMEPAVVRALIDDGPFLADQALSRGLVDAVVYEDQLLDGLPIPRNAGVVDLARYRQVRPIDVGIGGGPSIGVVFTEGTINFGTTGATVPTGQSVGSETWVRSLRAARDDPDIEAIILRIDSPGGVAIAADIMWREVVLARTVKPVIASMSDMAASGRVLHRGPGPRHRGPAGHAHRIDWRFRRQVRARGSARPDRRERGGGQRRRPGGALLAGDDVQRGRVGARSSTSSTRTYERFLHVVAEGRGMTRDEVHAVAQGRVWTGRQAKARGLVDELGGLRRAVDLAKERAGIAPEREVTLVPFPRRRTLWEQIRQSVSVTATVARLASPAVRNVAALLGAAELVSSGAPLLLLPAPASP